MWTMDNTTGFSQAHLDIINKAIRLMDTGGAAEESTVNDAINNAWNEQETAEELAADAAKLLGR